MELYMDATKRKEVFPIRIFTSIYNSLALANLLLQIQN